MPGERENVRGEGGGGAKIENISLTTDNRNPNPKDVLKVAHKGETRQIFQIYSSAMASDCLSDLNLTVKKGISLPTLCPRL